MVSLVVPVAVVGAATGVWGASGDVVGGGVAGDVDGDGAAGDKGGTALLAVYGVSAAESIAGEAPGEWWCAWRRCRECCRRGGCCW